LIQREIERASAVPGVGKEPAYRALDWKRNALRHSFGSYRLAITKNENLVAVEMGNSPQMLFANYRGVTTEARAAEYFAIEPEAAK
jgi:hypothetical protein